MQQTILEKLQGGLIVSCQALEDEPLHGAAIMARMARAAAEGGAVGIRANTYDDIAAIRREVDLPIIGIYKQCYADSDIYITPLMQEVEAVAAAGADIVSLDATDRPRPGNVRLEDLVAEIRRRYPRLLIMADISTLAEAVHAEQLGFDILSTTMSGYTPYSRHLAGPDVELVHELSAVCRLPIIAEGRYKLPEQTVEALEAGAWAVVVGAAITRPQLITQDFVHAIENHQRAGALKVVAGQA